MPDQKIDNLLNLAMDATPQERRKSGNLNIGYDPATRLWDVIIKYSGPESGLAGNGIQVVPLLGGYAVVTLPESEIDEYSHRVQVEFMEKPKRLYFELFQAKGASCIRTVQTGRNGLTGKGILTGVVDSGVDYFHPDFRNADGSSRILRLWDQSIQGTVEEVVYDTKAYATDERDVKKTAYVYLPYGYSEEKEYNILYLMHGTGDDEKYWLKTNPYNKTMLDNMIADGDIEPLIVVTPTFYVEDDCADDLDQLTYSFAKELRNDLMPEIESVYSTYAKSADDEGFAESRDHRAFAGLSRGAVTMYHSALCQSLDYFSWFGAFSGSRTDRTAFEDTIQTGDFAELPIHYLYVASGNFDFALPGQVQDYQIGRAHV